jgi:hypothetical protein
MTKHDTFTFTARSAKDPDKMAMFTLHNGSVSVDLGNALMEQASDAYESYQDDESGRNLTAWINPAVTGTLQKLVKPVPLADFDAELTGDSLQATAWVRAKGLRLAPVMMTWKAVDNPEGARAFVNELDERKDLLHEEQTRPALFDYWISWLGIGLVAVTLPILFIRLWRQRSQA